MHNLILRGLRLGVLLPLACNAQLYLITGSPETEFPMTLAEVTVGGTVKQVTELVPQWFTPGIRWPMMTVAWFSISNNLRRAVILPRDPSMPLMVLDLDRAAVIKACTAPTDEVYERWTVDRPGKGLTLEWRLADPDLNQEIYRGINLDLSIPCDQSFAAVDPMEVKYIVAHGSVGTGDEEARDGINASIDSNGNVQSSISTKARVTFGPPIPYALRIGLKYPRTYILINNPQILVVRLMKVVTDGSQFLALRKSDNTWHRIPAQSDYYDHLRGFDNFVAVVEGRLKKNIAAQKGRGAIYRGLKDEPGDESPGHKAWRKKPSKTGPDKEEHFMHSAAFFPGRLHLYDVNTERLYTIATNQADSEILLVENQTVYYRVTDRLYSAPVTEEGIGTARLLATGDLIQDAHWAFIKH